MKHKDTKTQKHEDTKKARISDFQMRAFFVSSCLCVFVSLQRQPSFSTRGIHRAAVLCCVLLLGGWTAIEAQAPATAQAHVAAARAVAYRPGQDFTWIFNELCNEPSPPQPRPAGQPAAAPAPRRIPARSEWFHEPAKVFDNLYYVGSQLQSMWAVTTSDGIILHDTAYDYMVEEQVDKGLRKLGLDPAQIKYVIVSHGHGDHYLGAKYLQQKYHPRIIMSEADWNFVAKDDTPAELKPERDMVATDAMKLTLGDTTLTLYLTPGHTPGTISTLIPIKNGNQRHLASIWGGNGISARGFSNLTEAVKLYSASAKRYRDIAVKAGADVYLSSHTVHDKTLDKLNALRFLNPGDPHPFVSKDAVQRHLTLVGECAGAQLAWLTSSAR
ncbi:MAG: MBL fold metallo-hydrolase [Acidobacteria bacterium]|nr:MAG: MBL fold metallo-hydrolase [Acidobacteriota bacterium]